MDLKERIRQHKLWLDGEGGEKANLRWADLRGCDMRGCDLRRADLCDCNLRGCDLRRADLRNCNLRRADLSGADLRNCDLSGADLRGCDMRGCDLRNCDLGGADIDFSCWPLWCGSNGVIVDIRIVRQLLAHVACLKCSAKEFRAIRKAIMPYAVKSYHANHLGLLEKNQMMDQLALSTRR